MLRLGILSVFLCCCLVASAVESSSSSNNVIYVNEVAGKTIRLKSVLSLMTATPAPSLSSTTQSRGREESRHKQQKIFWSVKRLYAMPSWINNHSSSSSSGETRSQASVRTLNELSQVENMISLDAEVEHKLQSKYSTTSSNDTSDDSSMYDLTIFNLNYADSGVYKCNLWNQRTIYYKLVVSSPIEKPEVILEQQGEKFVMGSNKMIMESSDVSIKCVSKNAYPLPSFKWFENGVELHSNEMEISYKLVDKENNMIESALKINKVNSEHHMRNLTCKLVQYQLSEQQQQQPSSMEQQAAGESGEQMWQTSDTLTLNVAFKPIVTMDVFKSSSQMMRLVRSPAAISLYRDDDDVWFRCAYRANPSDDRVTVVWKVNGVVQESDRSRNPDLFAWKNRRQRSSNVNAREANVSCEVENSVGKGVFGARAIQLYEPRLKLNTTRYQVDEFGMFQLNCSTDASPVPNRIEWRKYPSDSSDIDSATTTTAALTTAGHRPQYEVISSDSHLEFKSIRHTDTQSAYYVCVAFNSMNDSFGVVKQGERKFKFEIDVRFKPQMNVVAKKLAVALPLPPASSSPQIISTTSTDKPTSGPFSQNISCVCMANPQPVFNWYKNDVKLNSSKYTTTGPLSRGHNLFESVLTIHDLSENDLNNKYECEAMNQLGVNRLEIELVARSPPDRPTDLRLLNVDFMTASLSWSPGFDGGLLQTFFLDINGSSLIEIGAAAAAGAGEGVRVVSNGVSSVNVTRLHHDTAYTVRLMSRNSLGPSEWSEQINVRTQDLSDEFAYMLPRFDSLFLNVPKNRLEFEFATNGSSSLPIPVCLRLMGVSLAGARDGKTFCVNKCLPLADTDYSNGRYALDSNADLMLDLEQEDRIEPKKNDATLIGFDTKTIRTLKVSICFSAKPSICSSKPTSAIIDTYNKMSLGAGQRVDETNRRFGGMGPNSRLSIVLIIAVCGSLIALALFLLATVVFCIRKRNFKLCKALLSQQQQQQTQQQNLDDKSSNGSTGSTGSSRISNASSGGASSVLKKQEIPNVMNETEHRIKHHNQQQQQQQHANKSFNIDIASISAPMSLGNLQQACQLSSSDLNKSQTLVVGVPPMMSVTGASVSLLSTTAVSKTNSLNSRRAFTAALTATANTIIGKHKQQQQQGLSVDESSEIKVTEDEDKIRRVQQQQQQFGQFSSGLCSHFEDELHHSDTTEGSERSSDDEHKHATIQVASSQTSSTAVSNCSSTNLGPPYTLYSPFDSGIVGHHHATNPSGTKTSSAGFCSDSTGSNSDPIAINNSLSSNSTTDSPTYGYNLASGGTGQSSSHHDIIYISNNNNNNNNNKQSIGSQQHNKMSSSNKNIEHLESGYSTPSRPKKVVYEVIV